MDLNRVTLLGRLGRDPEIRATQSGAKVCNLSVATSERWRDKTSGEMQERTEWSRVVVFDEKLAEFAEQSLKSGSRVFVEGQLQSRKWTDQAGQERYVTEIVLNRFRGLLIATDSKGERQEAPRGGGVPDDPLGDEIPW